MQDHHHPAKPNRNPRAADDSNEDDGKGNQIDSDEVEILMGAEADQRSYLPTKKKHRDAV